MKEKNRLFTSILLYFYALKTVYFLGFFTALPLVSLYSRAGRLID